MLRTIFQFELLQLWRSAGIRTALALFMIIGVYALFQGKAVYDFQQSSITKTANYVARNDSTVRAIFDTLNTTTGKRTNSDIEAPFVLEWRLQDAQAKTILPLSILCIGQNDIYAPILSKHFNRPVFTNEFTEFQNPEQLLAGNLDVAFFVLFLMPLLIIALSYNVQSEDREAGIYPLLNAQSISVWAIVYQRLMVRFIVALIPVAIIGIVSLIVLWPLPDFLFKTFAQWWGVVMLYALFWIVIVVLVQRFNFSSLINAITLSGIWVMLLIAIPGIINSYLNYKYPANNKLEIAAYRDFDYSAWDKPLAEHKQIIRANFPNLNVEDKTLDPGDIQSFGYTLQVLSKEKELHGQFVRKSDVQRQAEVGTFWINPVGGIMRCFSTLSKSTLQQQQAFEKAIIDYRETKGEYLFVNLLSQPHFTKEDYQNMPRFSMPSVNDNCVLYLLPCLVFTLMLAVGLVVTSVYVKHHKKRAHIR